MSISEDQDGDIPDLDLASHGSDQYGGVSNLPENPIFHYTPMAQDLNLPPSLQDSSGNYSNAVDQADDSSASSEIGSTSPLSVWLDDDIMGEDESGMNEGGNSLYPSHTGPIFNEINSVEVEMEEVDTDGSNGSDDPSSTDEDDAAPHNNDFDYPLYQTPIFITLPTNTTVPSANLNGYQFPDPLSFPGAPLLAPGEDDLPPIMLSSGSAEITGSQNYGLLDFLRYWGRHGPEHQKKDPNFIIPNIHRMMGQISRSVRGVSYSDLNGDKCDMQGLNWESMGVTRRTARITRNKVYKNYTNIQGSDTITVRITSTGACHLGYRLS